MGVPSAAVVYTGESGNISGAGKGAAYSEGIGSTLEIVNKGLTDIRAHEKERKGEQEKKNAAWNKMLEDEDQDVWDVDSASVTKLGQAYNDFLLKKKYDGLDPNNLPSNDEKERRKMLNELKKEARAAQENKAWHDENKDKIEGDTKNFFDKQYATEYFTKFKNPNLSPSERNKMVREGSPLSKNVNLTDVVGAISEQIPTEDFYEKGYDIKRKNPKSFENLLGVYFKDAAGSDDYDALLKQYNNDPKALMDAANNAFNLMNADEKKKRPVTPRPAAAKVAENKPDDNSIKPKTYSKDASPNYNQEVSNNKIQFDKSPGVYVVGRDGTQYNDFKPVGGFKYRNGGAVDVFGTATDQEGKLIQVEGGVDYMGNRDQFSNVGYPDVFDLFRSVEDGTFSTPASSSSIPAANKASVQGINPN